MSDKPKCPVFGCTIPRGIPHEHPAGVSAVMRDPAEPLNRFERIELECYRKANKARIESNVSDAILVARYLASGSIFMVPADAPIHSGRKLRDALLQAGAIPSYEENKAKASIICNELAKKVMGDQFTHEEMSEVQSKNPYAFNKILPHAHPRSFVRTVGRIAAWIVVWTALFAFAGFALHSRFAELAGWWS